MPPSPNATSGPTQRGSGSAFAGSGGGVGASAAGAGGGVSGTGGGNGEIAAQMANSPVAREVYQFRTWNALMRLLFKARLGPEFNPDEG